MEKGHYQANPKGDKSSVTWGLQADLYHVNIVTYDGETRCL